MKNHLTHFDRNGSARMVDVSKKKSSKRIAKAKCEISLLPATLKIIENKQAEKGDVIGIARLAGIMATKKTAELIPLCHPLSISKVSIDFVTDIDSSRIEIQSTVKTTGKTGVEMEALTAVTISALTVYDMLKAVDKTMTILNTRLVLKDGGKSGLYKYKQKK